MQRCVASTIAACVVLAMSDSVLAQGAPEQSIGSAGPNQMLQIDQGGGQIMELSYVITPAGDAVIEGDMIIGEGQELLQANGPATLQSIGSAQLFSLFTRLGSHRWPNGVLVYSIADKLPEASKTKVIAAMTHWEGKTRIRFKKAETGTADYVEFVDPGDPNTCQSSVGRVGGRQVIKVGANCSTGNMIHEIGHALGLTHEQMRKDRDTFVTIHRENLIDDKYWSNFTIKSALYFEVGDYCYGSIMHYPRDAFAKAGTSTIEPRAVGVSIGQRDELDACDIKAIETQYKSEFAQ